MAASEIQFDGASWPGVPSFESASGTLSQGHEPDVITGVTSFPPVGVPTYGDFSFTDGRRTVTIRGCKLVTVQTTIGPGGYTYIYRFLDRRWRWRFGEVSGHYNARDRRDNLIPWMARSTKEIAEILLVAMGETSWGKLDLPAGVSSTELDAGRNNPAPGEKTPTTRTNPEVIWDGENPAVALDRWCQQFNRRLILDPISNKVRISRPGYGAGLPDNDYVDTVEMALDDFATPAGVGILGDVIRVQMRLKLIAVGEEWDGRFLPIEELSYRPSRVPRKGQWTVTFTVGNLQVGRVAMATFGGLTVAADLGIGASATARAFESAVNGTIGLASTATVTVTSSGTTVTITVTEVREGQGLDYTISPTVNGSAATATTTPVVQSQKSAWEQSDPAGFWDVLATDRLTYEAARHLALKSVWRYYRVADDDVSSGWDTVGAFDKINVPDYGKIDRREQLILQSSMVEQVVQKERDEERVIRGNAQFLSENPDYYDGHSRDRQPVVYGSVCVACNGDWFKDNHRLNTPPDKRIAAQFSLDPVNQLVIFGAPMFRITTYGAYPVRQPAKLVLETSVLVKDDLTHAPLRYRRWVEFAKQDIGKDFEAKPGEPTKIQLTDYTLRDGQPKAVEIKNAKDNHGKLRAGQNTVGIEWFQHQDVPYAVIGDYIFNPEKETYGLIATITEEDDVSRPRADYYLGGHLLEHQVKGGQTATYMGIHGIPLDGAIAQVTWNVGNGATTRASRNIEHDLLTPPLNARRRAENNRADEKAATQNYAESQRFSAFRASLASLGSTVGGAVARIFRG